MKIRISGISMLELITVIAIITLLFSLAFPAVQASRESSRRLICETRVRNFALAMSQSIDTLRKLPDNRFSYERNSVVLWSPKFFPYLGLTENFTSSFEAHTPPVLICPSASPPMRLNSISKDLTVGKVDERFAETIDYVANAGVFTSYGPGTSIQPFRERVGIVPDLFDSNAKRTLAEVRGGLSQTFSCWEVNGSKVRSRVNNKEIVSEWKDWFQSLVIRNDANYEQRIQIADQPSILRYVPSCVGLLRGYVGLYNIYLEPVRDDTPVITWRALNVSNKYHSPFSTHHKIVNIAFLDGSTRAFDEDCDHKVVMSLATACADK